MSQFEPPKVDGIAEPLSQVHISEVLRLRHYSPAIIAETLGLTVMDVEQALRRVDFLRSLQGWNHR